MMSCSTHRVTLGIVCLAILMILVRGSYAQPQKQTKPDEKGRDQAELIACRFSALDVFVEVKIEDPNSQPLELGIKNFTVYEDGIEQEIYSLKRFGKQSDGKFILAYLPSNEEFNGQLRKVQVSIRSNDGREIVSSVQIRLDANPELNFKTMIYSQGFYSAERLPTKQ